MDNIMLNISNKDEIIIEIENPKDVIEQYYNSFYTYPEHEYELYFQNGEITDNKLREDLLEAVFKDSENKDISEVLEKVTLLDNFYRTRIPSDNIVPIARHIVYLDIDDRLKHIDTDLVNEIAYQQNKYKTKDFKTDRKDLQVKIKNIYSFASKYCSWHNPDYPIADSYSKGMLYYINEATRFYMPDNKLPTKASLYDYEVYYNMYVAFKAYFKISNISNKVIDTYLWKYAQNTISYLKSKNLTCNIPEDNDDKKLSDYIKSDSAEIPNYLKERYNKY